MSLGMSTALSALVSAQRALQVIGHNLANANTPGYSRQRVELEALRPTTAHGNLLIGRGVGIDRLTRVADSLLDARIRTQESEVSRQTLIRDHLSEIETIFAEPGENGVGAMMGAFFASLSSLTSTPDDPGLRTGVIQSGRAIGDTLRLVRRQLGDVQSTFEAAATTEVERINALTLELEELNEQSVLAKTGREIPPVFLDRQEELLRQLSVHVDIQTSRDSSGRVSVVSGGSPILSPRGRVSLEVDRTGKAPFFEIHAERSSAVFQARGGRLKALQDLASEGVVEKISSIDSLARNLILEFNRVHATGIPSGGGHQDLVSSNSFLDVNNSGTVLDDRLSASGLPFEIKNGTLVVNVTDQATGDVTRSEIAIDPDTDTVADLRDALNQVSGISATVDPSGKLRIIASSGQRFDFSNRVLPKADLGQTFGAIQATVTGGSVGPFNFTPGESFTVSIDGTAPQTVTLNPTSFVNIAQASAAEVATAINSQVVGANAEVVDGRVVIRSNTPGQTSSIQLGTGTGTPLTKLGLTTNLDKGSDLGAAVTMSGSFEGSSDRRFVVRPLSDGTIGVTPGLKVEIRDASNNAVVATLDVGANYQPGSSLTISDGVSIAFGAGSVSASANDRFEVSLIAQGDTSDVLAATGLGGFFVGSDAGSIDVSRDLDANPGRLAAALSGAAGDNRNVLRMQSVRERPAAGLGDRGVDRFYQDFITTLGSESARAIGTLTTQELVRDSLTARRESISGVNLDEELLQMEQFQQTYQVAARFLQTVQEVTDVLVNLGR